MSLPRMDPAEGEGSPIPVPKEEANPSQASDDDDEEEEEGVIKFRPFTPDSIAKITRRIHREERRAKKRAADAEIAASTPRSPLDISPVAPADKKEEDRSPNPMFEIGKTLPDKVGDFPVDLYGKPIEDLDEYYKNKYTFMIVAKDKTIFRFSATKGFFVFTPFNPVRRTAMYILTHPFFSLIVMVVILLNCVFMAINEEINWAEKTFTGIYTVEGTVKMLARGFILADFTYLRDAWNWLDFTVVVLAYVTMGIELGNVAVLRTFRVLRALKTVAVVPGLKTIVGALMEAVRRLRDVMILSVFVLSIFALVGLQLYQGSMKKKCVRTNEFLVEPADNASAEVKQLYEELWHNHTHNKENWYRLDPSRPPMLCGVTEGGSGGLCPDNFTCIIVGENPDFGFTNFDNFGWAMLCAFRLMTQDYWENLYQQVIRTNGPNQLLFFMIVIFLGSFYLINVILAIVAMSYDDCRKQDQMDADLEAEEGLNEDEAGLLYDCVDNKSSVASEISHHGSLMQRRPTLEHVAQKDENGQLPNTSKNVGVESQFSPSYCGSPHFASSFSQHRSSQFSWRHSPNQSLASWRQNCVMPCLDNLDLPYADDSAAVTPTSEDLYNIQSSRFFITNNRRSSCNSRLSQLEGRFAFNSRYNQQTPLDDRKFTSQKPLKYPDKDYKILPNSKTVMKPVEPTHFHWNMGTRNGNRCYIAPSNIHTLQTVHCRQDSLLSLGNLSSFKNKDSAPTNIYSCRTPSATTIDLQDVLILKDLIKNASKKKKVPTATLR